MTLLKKLLLFGGIPAAGASAAAAPFVLKQLKNEKAEVQVEDSEEFDENEEIGTIDLASIEDKNDIDAKKQKALLWAAGLKCKKSLKEGSSCIPIENKGLRLKVDGKVEENLKFSSSSKGKLVLRKNKNTYSYGLRLSVEGEEITLEKADKSTLKLERFEGYGLVKESDNSVYLIKKSTAEQSILLALGLPTDQQTNCKLPLDGQTKTCSLTSEQIKSVHFDGKKEGGATIADSTKTITLKISKSVDTNLFNQGYRFAFSSPAEITINNGNVIKTNASTEFTVKDWKDEDMVLVRAGSGEKEGEFFSKVGLKCTGNVGNETCTIEDGKLNVIKANSSNSDNKLTEGKRTGTGKGIIKLHRNQANYVNGLKFSIEGEDITISGKPTDPPINRLSVFDGYEITESLGNFYLKRKEEGLAEIVKRLGIFKNPSDSVENPTEPVFKTTVTADKASEIKFYAEKKEAKTNDSKAIDVHGYRSTDTTNYKYGYRFTLKPTGGEISVGTTKLKKDVTYDFKIREESGNLYLERTIDPEKIIGLLGLSCTKEGDNTETCTFKTGKANVRHWGEGKNVINANTSTQGETVKLKLTKDQPGFTDGFMFTVEGGDITFTEGTVNTGNIRMSEFEKYEIQLKDGVWYLYQKKNFMQEKYSVLGIDQNCNNEFYIYCEMEATQFAEKLNFKAKKNKNVKTTFSNNAKVLIKLIKDSQLTTGIKVSMKVGGGDDKSISVVCSDDNSKELIKVTKEETIFKIEKIDNSFYLAKEKGEESNETCNSA